MRRWRAEDSQERTDKAGEEDWKRPQLVAHGWLSISQDKRTRVEKPSPSSSALSSLAAIVRVHRLRLARHHASLPFLLLRAPYQTLLSPSYPPPLPRCRFACVCRVLCSALTTVKQTVASVRPCSKEIIWLLVDGPTRVQVKTKARRETRLATL